MIRRILTGAVAGVLLLWLLPACSGGGGTRFETALGTISAGPDTRDEVEFDDTAALVDLAGKSWSTNNGFALLRGYGSSSLTSFGQILADNLHLSLFGADYGITAGQPPRSVGVLHGGQGSVSLSTLRKWGWRTRGDRMVAPGPADVGGNQTVTASLALYLAQVRKSGSDLVYGGVSAKLARADSSDGGATLADDPVIGPLADCLGDVVAADIVRTDLPHGVTGIAVGVRRPDHNTDTPRAVACVGWSTSAAADKYESRVRRALTSGTDVVTAEKYSASLHDPSVHDMVGSQHIVAWEADTPGQAPRIFDMLRNNDLPALIKCSSLPAPARSRYPCV